MRIDNRSFILFKADEGKKIYPTSGGHIFGTTEMIFSPQNLQKVLPDFKDAFLKELQLKENLIFVDFQKNKEIINEVFKKYYDRQIVVLILEGKEPHYVER